MEREEGYYWVKFIGGTDWEIGEYYGNGWQSVGSDVVYCENEIEEVGERIEKISEREQLCKILINSIKDKKEWKEEENFLSLCCRLVDKDDKKVYDIRDIERKPRVIIEIDEMAFDYLKEIEKAGGQYE